MKPLLTLIFSLSNLYLAFGECNKRTGPLQWSDTYSVQGKIIIPYAELKEPFNAWYDGKNEQSRIDYYGNMVQTYQLSRYGPYGTSIKIPPVTDEDEVNVKKCLQVNGTEENTIETQNILPSLEKFTCDGVEVIDGVQAEKWVLEEKIGEKENKYSMWLQYKTDESGEEIPVPIKYEMEGYNNVLGSHYDHYFLKYSNYDTSDIPSEIFEVDPNLICSSFPGPGDRHIYTFNPMREFIHPVSHSHVDFEFEKFKRKHRKGYKDDKEHALRKEIFRQNARFIHSVNRQGKSYALGINHLADKTDLELKALRGKQYTKGYNGGQPYPYHNLQGSSLPASFDWRYYGAVTPVKDQSVCGSCWAFGTVGHLEGALFLKNGGKNLVKLSEQALVDCTWGFGNNGCDGGEDFRVYGWLLKHGGIPTEEEYGKYLGQDGYCHANNTERVAAIKGFVNVTTNNENALKNAIVKHGPISVAIDAGHKTFSFYSHGVYYEPKCGNTPEQLDHAVLAVGYGTIGKQNYWLIKNSWSTYWGNDGYVLMSAKKNNCGVMTSPTYVNM